MEFKGIRGRLDKKHNDRLIESIKKQFSRFEPIGASMRRKERIPSSVDRAFDEMLKAQKSFNFQRREINKTSKSARVLPSIKPKVPKYLLEIASEKQLRSKSNLRPSKKSEKYFTLKKRLSPIAESKKRLHRYKSPKIIKHKSLASIFDLCNSPKEITEKPLKKIKLPKLKKLPSKTPDLFSKRSSRSKLWPIELTNVYDDEFISKICRETNETSYFIACKLGKPKIWHYKGGTLPYKFEHELRGLIHGNLI
ncbi:unnamed protein product [Blepharisma stoltei]|uniref:Uncharacterized protein n=1 Tax=Blepharisma stoltei TaxID=1481888 RepID=A0AAU9I7I5_9CILI|nr:unnamed protein product [Blepharisma stoltei]